MLQIFHKKKKQIVKISHINDENMWIKYQINSSEKKKTENFKRMSNKENDAQ